MRQNIKYLILETHKQKPLNNNNGFDSKTIVVFIAYLMRCQLACSDRGLPSWTTLYIVRYRPTYAGYVYVKPLSGVG